MKVILKPLDSQGYPGYGIALDGTVWSRFDTHGQITDQWSLRETYFRHRAVYVRLQVKGYSRDVRVALLLLEAVFGEMPRGFVGVKIRYVSGEPKDCSLGNLRYASRKYPWFTGAKYANTIPPGFTEVEV